MYLLSISLVFCLFNLICNESASEHAKAKLQETPRPIVLHSTILHSTDVNVTDAVFQSKDGGHIWEDISASLPEKALVDGFFVGNSEVYLRFKNAIYHSKISKTTPKWQKDSGLNDLGASIAFNRSGVIAFNYGGKIYQKIDITGTWVPIYTNFTKNQVNTVFETPLGTLFIGCNDGLYKSIDKGQTWKQVRNYGWMMKIVESGGILVATGEQGIMRSVDNGENWDWVISEGGVGIDVALIDGGFAAITYNTTSKSRRMRISLNGGKTWDAIDSGIEASESISSIRQMGKYFFCGHPKGILRSSDMGKTWQLVRPSIGKKVFNIYVSGSVLYAVPRDFGC